MSHKPKEGSAEEEKEESAEEAQQEGDTDSGVVIPEDFQQDVHNVLKKSTTKHHLSHIRDRVYAKEDEMRKAEQAKNSKGKKGKGPDEYSMDSAPASLND